MKHTQPDAKFLARLQKHYAKASKKTCMGMLYGALSVAFFHALENRTADQVMKTGGLV